MKQKIQISVVIPAYNAEQYITRAIESVSAQTQPVDEIIVVDDGSTDNTAQIVKEYGDRVRYIRQENAGVSAARNTGIQAAKGDWIAFLDADDEWLPDYLEKQAEVLQLYPDLVWTIANYCTCSCSENRMAPHVVPEKAKTFLKKQKFVEDYFVASIKEFHGCTDTIIIKKEVLFDVGMFRTDIHKGEDLDMWWRIAYRHPCVGLNPEPLAIYHLGIQGSGNKRGDNWKRYAELISEHLAFAQEYGRLHSYRPFVSKLLCGWIRGMLFRAQKEDIRQLLRQFPGLIPAWYRYMMYVLTVFPYLTKACCLFISKVVRKLRLRRRIVAPPDLRII